MATLALIFFIAFFGLAWRDFKLALGFFIVILPAYLIRPVIFGLPTTVLELAFGALVLVWLVKYFAVDRNAVVDFFRAHKFFTICFSLFFIASVSGIFVSDMQWYSLGQWRAYFLEPIILFIIIMGRRSEINSRFIISALAVSSLSVSTLAVWQTLTGGGFPPGLWDDVLDGRVVSFFTTPNAVGLYLAPIIFLPLIFIEDENKKKWLALAVIVLAVLAVVFSRSVGAVLALAVGGAILGWLAGFKKLIIAAVVAAVIVLSFLPGFTGFSSASKSWGNRLLLWDYSGEFLISSPKNFVWGAGIRQFFRKVQKPHYDAERLERLIYPHNIFLNFWMEIGLIGMLSFAGLFVWALYRAGEKIKQNWLFGSVLAASLVVFFVHGLVDVPYFKNDLAFLFWIILSLLAV